MQSMNNQSRTNRRRLAVWLPIAIVLFVAVFQSRRDSEDKDAATGGNPTASDSVVVELTGADSVTVFELLQHDHDVGFKSSLQGKFVTRIDSIETGNDHFWVYTVNDSSIAVACDKYVTRTGDRIVWHFRRFSP